MCVCVREREREIERERVYAMVCVWLFALHAIPVALEYDPAGQGAQTEDDVAPAARSSMPPKCPRRSRALGSLCAV